MIIIITIIIIIIRPDTAMWYQDVPDEGKEGPTE